MEEDPVEQLELVEVVEAEAKTETETEDEGTGMKLPRNNGPTGKSEP